VKKIVWHIGTKKVVWDLKELPLFETHFIGPVEVVQGETRLLLYWEDEHLVHLMDCNIPLLGPAFFMGTVVKIEGEEYRITFIEHIPSFGPCRLHSPFVDDLGFSHFGWHGFRYMVEK
jgi:hypothetical protein